MRYADTCLLLSRHLPDAGTPAALAWLEGVGDAPIMASHWGWFHRTLHKAELMLAQPLQM